jgi:hypothetical protein
MMKFKTLPRKLRIFDFDDTLVTTDAKIKIPNKGLVLSTQEFADYKPAPDDIIDLSDFETGELINPKPTNFMTSAFKNIIGGESDVMILTARPNTNGIREFLSQWVDPGRLIIVGGKVGATGEELAQLKKNAILKRLNDYEDIRFYDDSKSNINAVKSLKSPKIKTQLIVVKK